MNTLSIPEIFNQFDFYQAHYLAILADPQQYYTPVTAAHIHVWPTHQVTLYLGDLLQLWFSEKWKITQSCVRLAEQQDDGHRIEFHPDQQGIYLFQVAGSALSGANRCLAWSVAEQKMIRISLDSAFKYYCFYKSLATVQTVA